MKRPRFLIFAMALAALFFGWRTYRAWKAPAVAVAPPPPASAVAPIGISPEEAPHAADLSAPLASILARPVFRPDRRPFQEISSAVPARNYEQELSRFTLLGVLLLGDLTRAVITGKAAGRPERFEVGPGESLPGFEVKEIRQDGVLLTADGKEFTLPLYAGAPKAQGPGALRTELPPPQAPAASLPSGQSRPPAAPVRAESGTAPPRAGMAGASPARVQPQAPVAPPGQPGGPAPVYPTPYRGRVRPSYMPGQR
jgi:general secretion pathway protein N